MKLLTLEDYEKAENSSNPNITTLHMNLVKVQRLKTF